MKSRRALGKPIQSEVGVSKTKNRPRGSVFVLSCVDKKDAIINHIHRQYYFLHTKFFQVQILP